MRKTKRYAIIISIVGLVLILTGVTYSFFNYTKTGLANNIRVGNVSFNTTQNGSISLTNVFPITSDELSGDVGNHDSVSVSITGSTDYNQGLEYLVSFSDVNNSTNNKKVPIAYNVTGTNIGTSSENYYENRGGNTSLYKIFDNGEIKNNKYIAVGYIASGQTGINGSITITAYIDANQMVITDTYDSSTSVYVVNPNITSSAISDCVTRMNYKGWSWDSGETVEAFCAGIGTNFGDTFQEILDDGHNFDSNDIEYFLNHGIIVRYTSNNLTSSEWVAGRTVFTTDEWRSFQGANAISFKIRIEANLGVWVDEESTSPNCFTVENHYVSAPTIPSTSIPGCVSYLTSIWGEESEGNTVDDGETYQDFCAGTGTNWGNTFSYYVTNSWFSSSDLEAFAALNMVNVGTVTITNYDTTCGLDVVIPKKINGGTVTEIGTYDSWNGFANKGLTSVVIPNTVTTLQAGVFTGNELTSIVLPNSITSMSEGVFTNNKLTSISFSSNLQVIEMNDFSSNYLTELVIPEGVTTVHRDSFRFNHLTSVYLPSTITYVGDIAFGNNDNLTSIHINKACSFVRGMSSYPWVNTTEQVGLTVYGLNNEVCDSW